MNKTNKHSSGNGSSKANDGSHEKSPSKTQAERSHETKPGVKKAESKES
ncbi:hypothetical protein JVX91_27950 [Pseudomonas sp. PDNC002]|nr:hypothetical protein [Pseudomonas sp. PDNC002]QRY79352.1 hypothetical protein JVX91_27950 [Pseudomonas sp. PDNC002]